MSSLSTLPNGDSAWLLRKAIERIMQQVSVLETNIGSSTTGNSANTQIIFNDNGTLRGDAGFTYNAATDTLTVGAATITGNLTVDTNTLFVDSVNNRVGIGTVTPARPVDIVGSFQSSAGWALVGSPAGLGGATRYIGGAGGTDSWYFNALTGGNHLWAFGEVEAMRLNATGLGVGLVPSYKLDVQGADNSIIAQFGGVGGRKVHFTTSVNGGFANGFFNFVSTSSVGAFSFQNTNGTHLIIDSSGNVGIGVGTFGTSAAKVLAIATGTEPTTGPAGTVQFFTSTRSASNTIPAIFCEGSGVTNAAITNTTVTNKIAIKVNGTIYYLLATTSAA